MNRSEIVVGGTSLTFGSAQQRYHRLAWLSGQRKICFTIVGSDNINGNPCRNICVVMTSRLGHLGCIDGSTYTLYRNEIRACLSARILCILYLTDMPRTNRLIVINRITHNTHAHASTHARTHARTHTHTHTRGTQLNFRGGGCVFREIGTLGGSGENLLF